jgi:hypothetical protein
MRDRVFDEDYKAPIDLTRPVTVRVSGVGKDAVYSGDLDVWPQKAPYRYFDPVLKRILVCAAHPVTGE